MTDLRALRPFVGRPSTRAAPAGSTAETCELCGVELADVHRHLVDLERRTLGCACPACALLFTGRRALGGRFRTIPTRVVVDPAFTLTEPLWAALEIPVRLAFFLFNSSRRRWVASYPSAAGAVESELSLAAWDALAAQPLVAAIEPDVEALLAYSRRGATGFECLLVPVDACYELVATVRRSWRGFEGGDARREIDAFFARLRERSRPIDPGGAQ